ncbi:TraR/DksA family transcriptional regulator [Streptomyces silvisoli]|uniref:TraR/DksA C4-type zinc finger protein n=1 Tax=Streptomyces silvisoli TaxID=3034235 RepID=A0ABT5ZFK9_9ACTN|nr:TraR/DksA C4-type zinc finger protein [Streptomyces silvisoli]MDF3288613.1 TraR/DksA C4-type zinc finger protein [Streptomyces silvisoli]
MVVKKTAAPKRAAPTAKKAAARKTSARKAAVKRTPANKAPAKKAPAKKAAAKKAPAKKGTAKKAAKKETVEKEAASDAAQRRTAGAGKAPAKKAAAKKTAARSTTTKKAPAAKKSATAKQTGAKTVVAKKTASRGSSPLPSARTATDPVDPGTLAVRPGEEPWSEAEVAEARTVLMDEAARLRTEILASENAISGLMRDSGDGAGDDQADVGTKNISREHEIALAENAREMLVQTEHALERLDNGTYGLCESCGKPIGKARMQAFPRATLCVECKQRTERR